MQRESQFQTKTRCIECARVFDLNRMINAVHDSRLFYLRTPSDLMDKKKLLADLEMAVSFLQDLRAEGYNGHDCEV